MQVGKKEICTLVIETSGCGLDGSNHIGKEQL